MASLSDNEKALFEGISNHNTELVKELIEKDDVRIHCLDEYGTTPLQQAAFKGNKEICEFLLAHGADVNSNEHQHGYTTLMFAALSGNAELCRILLEAGAKTYVTNRLGKTASQMGAFTGQHHCVSVINNFLCVDYLEYYTKARGSETEARLPGYLVLPLHTLACTSNIHPLKVILFLVEHSELITNQKAVLYVLEDIIEKQMRQRETNEVMALKLHVVFKAIKASLKFITEHKETNKSNQELLLSYAKSLLASKDSSFAYGVELLLRQIVKEFPFQESTLFMQIIKTLSQVQIGQTPTAITVINQVLLGHMRVSDSTFCATCGDPNASKRCGACRKVSYCSETCQKLHWFTHKRWCSQLKQDDENGKSIPPEENSVQSVAAETAKLDISDLQQLPLSETVN